MGQRGVGADRARGDRGAGEGRAEEGGTGGGQGKQGRCKGRRGVSEQRSFSTGEMRGNGGRRRAGVVCSWPKARYDATGAAARTVQVRACAATSHCTKVGTSTATKAAKTAAGVAAAPRLQRPANTGSWVGRRREGAEEG